MLILVGFPGSGKSCVAARLAAHLGYDIVNQDTLGDRYLNAFLSGHARGSVHIEGRSFTSNLKG